MAMDFMLAGWDLKETTVEAMSVDGIKKNNFIATVLLSTHFNVL